MQTITVKSTLYRSKAKAECVCDLNQHFGLALWSNQHDQVKYQHTNHHTLSLYLEGGHTTRRTDQPFADTGAPNRLCILPAAQESDWHVGEPLRFMHIYFTDAIFKHFALQAFDIDPRLVELPDKTFFQDPLLLKQLQSLLSKSWTTTEQHLLLQEAVWEILGGLLTGHAIKPITQNTYRGGLTKTTIANVIDYIDANIDRHITIEHLAQIANLSPFHFSRMFKASVGLTPHQQVMNIRIHRARELLLTGLSQLATSAACGFANQSHFSREFRKYYGITPRQFLQLKAGHRSN